MTNTGDDTFPRPLASHWPPPKAEAAGAAELGSASGDDPTGAVSGKGGSRIAAASVKMF